MAALREGGRYGVSCGGAAQGNITVLHVKLTETAVRALESYQGSKVSASPVLPGPVAPRCPGVVLQAAGPLVLFGGSHLSAVPLHGAFQAGPQCGQRLLPACGVCPGKREPGEPCRVAAVSRAGGLGRAELLAVWQDPHLPPVSVPSLPPYSFLSLTLIAAGQGAGTVSFCPGQRRTQGRKGADGAFLFLPALSPVPAGLDPKGQARFSSRFPAVDRELRVVAQSPGRAAQLPGCEDNKLPAAFWIGWVPGSGHPFPLATLFRLRADSGGFPKTAPQIAPFPVTNSCFSFLHNKQVPLNRSV